LHQKLDRKLEAVAANPGVKKELAEARAGSIRSPLWRGGGVIFGPKPRDFEVKMNKRERRLALRTAFYSRTEDLIVVEDFAVQFSSRPKTKDLLSAIARWGIEPDTKILLILPEPQLNVYLSGRNIELMNVILATSLNVYDVLAADKIIVTSTAIAKIQEIYGE
jgi:LSU ribosomal protein L4P